MARSRNIKPGFFTNAELLECQPLARLLFAGLWTEADCRGILEDRAKNLKIKVLPGDNCDAEELLQELEQAGMILRYQVDGIRCIFVKNFGKHQNPHVKEKPNSLPAPDEYEASPVLAPDQHEASPADSLLLIPDSPTPSPDGDGDAPEKNRRSREAPKVPLPGDLTMSAATVAWCQQQGYTKRLVEQEFEVFRDSAVANGRKYADWQAAFRNWLKRCETNGWGQVKETSHIPRVA